MYLLHVLGLNVVKASLAADSGWTALRNLALAYALDVLAGELLYVTVERPARRFGRRWLAGRGEAAVAV